MKKSSIINGLSWSFAENILTEIVNFIVSIVLARYIYPSDYGLIALIQIFITITSIIVSNGLGAALIQDKDINEEQISTLFYLNLFVGLLFYCALFVFAPIIATKYNNAELILIMRILGIKIPISSIYSMQHSYIKKKLEFKKFFFSSLIGTIIAGIVGIFLAYRGYGHWALIISTLIDQIIDSIVLFITSKWFPKFKFSIKNTRKQLEFGLHVLMSEFVTRLFSQLRPLIIGVKYSTADLAYDSKAQKIPNAIINVANSSVTRVLIPTLSNTQDDNEEMKMIARKSVQIYSFFICPIMAGIYSTSDIFIPLFLTSKWSSCIPYIKLYCLINLILSFSIYDIKIIQAKGKGKMLLFCNFISVINEVLFLTIFTIFSNNPLFLIIGSFCSTLLNSVILSIFTKKLINYSFWMHLLDYAPSCFVAIIMCLIVKSITIININHWILLFLQIILGVIFYFLLSILFKLKPMTMFLEYVKSISNSNKTKL